jgi:predicted O-methyltransferase YrrM
MDNFEKVRSSFGDLEYMHHPQAKLLRDLIIERDAKDVLEIGFFHGKSSAYIASILEDLGRGHLVTVDLDTARKRQPNIEQVLSTLDLAHRVTPVYACRSYTWELARMIQANPMPQFDLCYFDGGHTWDVTGFGFVLVDMLLRPGGWIVFDDLPWTIDAAMQNKTEVPTHWRAADAEERRTPAVRLVFDLLVPRLGYTDSHIVNDGQWGVARKPLDDRKDRAPARGVLRRIFDAMSHQ